MPRERYGLIGTGGRAGMYIDALTRDFEDQAELVAWSDTNPGRLDYYDSARSAAGLPLPRRYPHDQIERMVTDERLDRVIVTTPDFTHADIASRMLAAGADVVIEKPLTINVAGVRQLHEAMATSGHDLVTTFNYRYSPRNAALKTLIQSGAIGQVTSVHFEWVLDTSHGADYFRRWHRYKQNSGGLLIHKASHHFDLVNWWLDAAPVRVFASGGLRFYGAENARARGLAPRPTRGTDAPQDPFSLDLSSDPALAGLFLGPEANDGYLRDRDVFDDGITIEDNLAAVVDYDSGATMSYSLNAHSPWEGYRVMVNGTEGRAELEVVERGAVLRGGDGRTVVDPSAQPGGFATGIRPTSERLVVQRHWQLAEEVPIAEGVGGHGGGDAQLLSHLFNRVTVDEPLHRIAGFGDGVRAISVGIAANASLESGQPVLIADLDLPG